jgi:hypothetical protein
VWSEVNESEEARLPSAGDNERVFFMLQEFLTEYMESLGTQGSDTNWSHPGTHGREPSQHQTIGTVASSAHEPDLLSILAVICPDGLGYSYSQCSYPLGAGGTI